MRIQLKQFSTVAGLTILEAVRQPICLLVTVSCILFISLLPLLITHTLGEAGKLVRDSALAVHLLCGLLLGSFAACASLAHEIHRGTASAILSKPVSRELFFLAKFTGIAVVMLVFSLGATLATIMSTRMAAQRFDVDWWVGAPLLLAPVLALFLAGAVNFFTRRSYVSSAFYLVLAGLVLVFIGAGFFDEHGHRTAFGALYMWPLVPASVLIALAALTLSAVAVALATRLDIVPTVSVCTVVFLMGLMSDYLFGRHAEVSSLASFLYAVVPNWQHFWTVDALSGAGIPWAYVGQVAGYAVIYTMGVLAVGTIAFRHMDVR